jgi:CHAD domain-containing protein
MSAADYRLFDCLPGFDWPALASSLPGVGRWQSLPDTVVSCTLLDTHDKRLETAGWVLEHELRENDAASALLRWRSRGWTTEHAAETMLRTPRRQRDLPSTESWLPLASAMGGRALLPLAKCVCRISCVSWDDASGGLQARLHCCCPQLRLKGGKLRDLPAWLRLEVRGLKKSWRKRLLDLLEELGSLQPAAQEPWNAVLAAMGRGTGASQAGPLLLAPLERADASGKRILLRLADVMEGQLEGVSRDLDAEFLHDLRVALRRTRVFLAQVRDLYPPETVQHFREQFAALARLTAPLRDMDVQLEGFSTLQASLPPEQHKAFEAVRRLWLQQRRQSLAEVRVWLKSPQARRLFKSWRVFLGTPLPRRSALAGARLPVRLAAAETLLRLYRKFCDKGRRLGARSPAAAWHEQRMRGKKLRYVLEFFRSLYLGPQVPGLIRELQAVQDLLGEHQDCAVQHAALASALRGLSRNSPGRAAVRLAQQQSVARQHVLRTQWPARFAAFREAVPAAQIEALFSATP